MSAAVDLSIGSQFRSLRDHVVDNLRDRIIDGDFVDGHRLVERDVSDELGVSRITVREALQQLANEGLVALLPRRGAVVTELGVTEARDLLEVRESLDVTAARLAATRHDRAGAARLRALLDEAQQAIDRDDRASAAVANLDFHEQIGAMSGNAVLHVQMSTLHRQLRRLFRMARELRTDHTDDHAAILAAIVDRDPDRAADLAQQHIRAVAEATLALLDSTNDGDEMSSHDTAATRYLHAAARGDLAAVRALLAEGVDIDTTNQQRRTAILLAAMNGHHEVVDALIEAGADLDKQDETCFNPFLYGCVSNDLRLVRTMVAAGADLDRYTRFGGVGIHPPAEKGFVELVRELVETTAINVNHTNWVGWTPLLEAIVLNDGGPDQQKIVELLLDHGANPHMTDKYGKTPLQLARELGYTEIAALLVDAGA